MSLVQTVFSRKANSPGNHADYKENFSVFMKYRASTLTRVNFHLAVLLLKTPNLQRNKTRK